MMRPRVAFTHRDRHRRTAVGYCQAATQTVGRTHGDGTDHAVTQLLLNFERQTRFEHLQCVIDLRHGIARELHVNNRANDLNDFALAHYRFLKIYRLPAPYTAAAPATISESSVVIAA